VPQKRKQKRQIRIIAHLAKELPLEAAGEVLLAYQILKRTSQIKNNQPYIYRLELAEMAVLPLAVLV
jgi:radical SAM superfamily enzyme